MPLSRENTVGRALRNMMLSEVMLYCLFIGAIIFVWWTGQQIEKKADRSTIALCALRDDLNVRIDAGEQFLKEHPDGIPGIPASTLRTSIDGQRRTVIALSVMRCNEV